MEAAAIDSQFFLSDISGLRDPRVHFKQPSAYTLPVNLRAEHLEQIEAD